MSGSSHMEFTTFWIISLLFISTIPKGDADNRSMIMFSVLFISFYIAMTVSISKVYDDAFLVGTSRIATNLTHDEVVGVAGLVLISIVFMSMRDWARKCEEDRNQTKQLLSEIREENDRIHQELTRIPKEKDLNPSLESPISKVIGRIRKLQVKECDQLSSKIIDDLDYVIFFLQSNNIFEPQLEPTAFESDIGNWLKETIAPTATHLSGSLLALPFAETKRKSANPSLSGALENIDSWDFNIFNLQQASNSAPLYYLGLEVFNLFDFNKILDVPEELFRNFLREVEANYHKSNKYHNSTHAADVLHCVYYFISVLDLRAMFSIEDIFACVVAAIIHDVDHPGFNNQFLIATRSPLATRYNDISVLENHHCSKGFQIMNDPACCILNHLPPDKRKSIRSSVISMVLATDMVNHFEIIAKFKNKVNGDGLDVNDRNSRQLLMETLMKCADISNAAKTPSLSMHWSSLVMSEFFKQGEEEMRRGLPVSKWMDPNTSSISKCQFGFIDLIVFPLYEIFCKYIKQTNKKFDAMENLEANRKHWKM